MFKITPIEEKTRQKELCDLCGIKYIPLAFAYQMYDMDTGDIMGMSQFEIGEFGYIYDIAEAPDHNDFEAMFILARQTMNFIDYCEVHICYADDNCADEEFLKAIGFKKNGDKYFCDMNGMFDGKCGCK